MALKALIKTLDDVAEPLREHYTKLDDGTYKLDADGVEDVSGLKTALEHEREERRAAKQKLADQLTALDGIDLELAKKLIGEHDSGKRKEMIDAGKVDELIAAEVEKRITKMSETHTEELTKITTDRDGLKVRLESELIDNALQTDAAKAGVLAEALPDVIRRGREVFHLEEGAVVAKDSKGEIVYGENGKDSQTTTEFMAELKSGARHLFASSTGGGAGRKFNPGNGGAGDQGNEVRGAARMRASRESA